MDNDQTPINARPKRRSPEALEDLSLALRDRVLWPIGDRFLSLSDGGRAAVAGGAVVLALAIGVGGYSLVSSEDSEPTTVAPVAVTTTSAPAPEPVKTETKPEPEPTLQGAAPVFKALEDKDSTAAAEPETSEPAAVATTASNSGNAATDTISSQPGATTAARASTATESVDGPPAGPAAIAVARKFADAFVVYETGAEKGEVRQAFKATAAPEVTKALLQRPPRQPAGVEVPKAKVLNIVPAPSHEEIYPVSVSLLRVGVTSELRLELEQLKNKDWRVVNVLG